MDNSLDFCIGDSFACREVKELGFFHFGELTEYVRSLPYGRPADTVDPISVLRERRGTCSSKHRLLAIVARESGHPEFQLTIGIYKMSERNTPGVGSVLRRASMQFLPEAHCYLSLKRERLDFTGLPNADESPFQSLLEEHLVSPDELPQIKSNVHHRFLELWARSLNRSVSELWATREACIAALSANMLPQGDARNART